MSSQTGQHICSLKGHLDFSFACAWSPNGNLIATGNQDTTVRLYDARNMASTLAVFEGRLGALRALRYFTAFIVLFIVIHFLRFTYDSKLLIAAEPADFVHVFNIASDQSYTSQIIDFFGEIAGISVCHDYLYIGCADETYGSIMEFERTSSHSNDIFI